MTSFTIQEVARRSGLSEPTLRYYEDVGLVGPIDRDASSGHRRYGDADVDTLEALACLRAAGVSIDDMRTYLANRARGREAAAEQRDLLLRHAVRIEAEIAAQHVRLAYLRGKAELWDARDRGDEAAETAAIERLVSVVGELR
ncbi:MerR family transcriptional regulator [Kribbella sindirgiensis]|uniref:MerR family transcriptional regulator n=1 Tax=Kribbella sindirgiensis TaxID=1124744 RepID=A0A4R0JBB4_9ACTN|nr:MerR family transcriptional regulator [Kribbella sindirgiensis]TCC43247.1 MerR family transcriptional regulator [Kribbella sindirgiensis]